MSLPKATRIEKQTHPGPPRKLLDLKFGYALLIDRRVPLRSKGISLAIGIAVIVILGFLELPVEEVVAAIPVLGIIGDLTIDGAEAIIGPVLVACLMLPYLAPVSVVERIRREREPGVAPVQGPIIDV